MKNIKKLYKILMIIVDLVALVKIKNQLCSIYSYNKEIISLNEKIAEVEEEISDSQNESEKTKENNEDMARKKLKMYYPNETPYKGY